MFMNPWDQIADLEFGNEGDRPTWPPAGSAALIIEDKYEPMFISATWTIVATVDDVTITRSNPNPTGAHSPAFIKRWSRQMIRTRYEDLRRLGVDADAEYVKWGGDLKDLKP